MRRRLIRLLALSLLVPMAARLAILLAERLEAGNGPTKVSRSLRSAANLARRSRRGR